MESVNGHKQLASDEEEEETDPIVQADTSVGCSIPPVHMQSATDTGNIMNSSHGNINADKQTLITTNEDEERMECDAAEEAEEVPRTSHLSHDEMVISSSWVEEQAESSDVGPDFSRLPDFFWIRVLQLLPLADRYHMSQVNWFMNTLFYDVAVWREATLPFAKALVHSYFYIARYKLKLLERDKRLARKFGRFYRDITLCMRGRPEEFEPDTREIMNNLRESWHRLTALSLDLGDREWGAKYHRAEDGLDLSLLQEVADILEKSVSLRHLSVRHWPQSYLTEENGLQLKQVLLEANCPKLMSLSLPRCSENGIRTLSSPRDLAVEVVDKFRCLRYIHLPSDMLSNALFEVMVTSRLDDIRTLSVEVNGFWSTGCLNHLLSSLSWSILTSRWKDFRVALTVSADVPEFAFEQFLVPEIPLSSITFDINCHCYRKAFVLLQQYSEVLRSFRCFSQPEDLELDLLDMVRACCGLQYLIFYGRVSDYNVLRLAEAGGHRWRQLGLLWKNIEKTCERPTPFNLVSQFQTAQQHQDRHHHHQHSPRDGEPGNSIRTEQEVKEDFCRQVSQHLGFPWEPVVL